MYEPVRGGTRGGKDQFKWDDLRTFAQNDREQYLGFTTKLGYLDKGGKWRRRDWYAQKKDEDDGNSDLKEELRLAKEADERRIKEALGLGPAKKEELTKQEMLDLTAKIKNPQAELGWVQRQEYEEQQQQQSEAIGLGYSKNAAELEKKALQKAKDGTIGNVDLNPYKLEGMGLSNNVAANDYEMPVIQKKAIQKQDIERLKKDESDSDSGKKKSKKSKKEKKHKKDKKKSKKSKKHKKEKKHKREDTDSEQE